jgi:hypothetical protein
VDLADPVDIVASGYSATTVDFTDTFDSTDDPADASYPTDSVVPGNPDDHVESGDNAEPVDFAYTVDSTESLKFLEDHVEEINLLATNQKAYSEE